MAFDFYFFSFSIAELVCFGCFFCLFLYQIYYYLRYMKGAMRYDKKTDKTYETSNFGVSVVICAKNEEENLKKYLPLVLEQDYSMFEVIVINDASYDNTAIFLDDLKNKYSNLRTTFVPYDTKNISTKKLGLTLGIKAAKYDHLLFTDADCAPASKNWLSLMVRNFTPKTEFILGYGAYNEYPTFLNRLITYDTLFVALQYMGMALAKKPYMGVGRNLAYRKDTFFKQNGFASSLHLLSGDDDLLVNRAATADNLRVEVSKDSVTWSEPKKTFHAWTYQKIRHLSASDSYTGKSRTRLFIEPFTRGLFYATFILCMVFGNYITMAVAGLVFIARYLVQLTTINKASKHFGGRSYIFMVLFADIFLPLKSLSILMFKTSTKRQRQKIRW